MSIFRISMPELEDCDERRKFVKDFWHYYTMLEDDCITIRRFVDFREENFGTCSDEIIKTLLSVCAEFDNVCKRITGLRRIPLKNKPTGTRMPKLNDYAKVFFNKSNLGFKSVTVVLRNSDIKLRPFLDWSKKHDPFWWEDYNSVKHHREDYYSSGNLKSLLNAFAGLYFLIRYEFYIISQKNSSTDVTVFDFPPDQSKLFYLEQS